ncbi:MAG: hypothetical protein GMKNLPBB_00612 [Myxococcota bacterium]|nr:hypothetical protein [Myxococcota bacterium]
MKPVTRHIRHGGFTMMEVLVASTILAMIGVTVWMTFGGVLRGRDRMLEVQDRYQQVRQAMQRMANEITHAYISIHRWPAEERTRTVFIGEDEGDFTRLTFCTMSGLRLYKDSKTSDQNVITYFMEASQDTPGTNVLMRREKRRIDDKPQAEEGTVSYPLIENVRRVKFKFWDPQEGGEDKWVDRWDTTAIERANRLPTRVRIIITLAGENREDVNFITETRIFMTFPLGFGNI